jgi:hypothetical protein
MSILPPIILMMLTGHLMMGQSHAFTIHDGKAKDIPLNLAMRQLIPETYELELGLGKKETQKVSIDGGKPWVVHMLELAERHDLEVRFQKKEISLIHASWDGASQNIKSYQLRAGSSLHETVHQWASQEGWHVDWNGDWDYPIKASTIIEGNLITAYKKLLEPFGEAEPPLSAVLYPDSKILRIDIHAGS